MNKRYNPRVLQVMAGAEYGGAEAFFIRLVQALHRAGLEQRVVIRDNPRRAEALKSSGLETIQLPFGGFFDFRTTTALKRQIRSFQPDIVITWMNRATIKCPTGDFLELASGHFPTSSVPKELAEVLLHAASVDTSKHVAEA